MYQHKPRSYTPDEIAEVELAWDDEIFNGVTITKERLCVMLEMEASGAWGKRVYASEKDMYATLTHGMVIVTAKELEKHMKQKDTPDELPAMRDELREAMQGKREISPERLNEIEEALTEPESEQTEQELLEEITKGSGITPEQFKGFMQGDSQSVELEEEDDDYYEPPERKMCEVAITPDDARADADKFRKMLLNPKLSRYEAEEIANDLAIRVSAYYEVEDRLKEIGFGTPRDFESKAHSEAERLEYNALTQVKLDKDATTHTSDSLSSTARTLGLMNRGELGGRTIDLRAYKESIEKQMDELVASGTAREKRIAKFVILAEGAAERLMIQATVAPTSEAKAMVMKSAMKCIDEAGKQVGRLDAMATPKTGRLVEHVPDKQITQKPKKLSEQTTGRE